MCIRDRSKRVEKMNSAQELALFVENNQERFYRIAYTLSLIHIFRLSEDTASDPYIGLIKRLAVNEKLDFDTAKVLISAYKKTKGE